MLLAISAVDARHSWSVGDSGTIITTSALADNQAPALTIDQPITGGHFTIADQPVLISGTINDENGAILKIGTNYLPVSGNTYSWLLNLPNGEQTIRVQASDAAGNISVKETTVEVEMNLPTGEMQYYLSGTSGASNLNLSFSPNDTSSKIETYIVG